MTLLGCITPFSCGKVAGFINYLRHSPARATGKLTCKLTCKLTRKLTSKLAFEQMRDFRVGNTSSIYKFPFCNCGKLHLVKRPPGRAQENTPEQFLRHTRSLLSASSSARDSQSFHTLPMTNPKCLKSDAAKQAFEPRLAEKLREIFADSKLRIIGIKLSKNRICT